MNERTQSDPVNGLGTHGDLPLRLPRRLPFPGRRQRIPTILPRDGKFLKFRWGYTALSSAHFKFQNRDESEIARRPDDDALDHKAPEKEIAKDGSWAAPTKSIKSTSLDL
jgi:hypothetical protein